MRHHRGTPATDQAAVDKEHLTAAARRLNRRMHARSARSNHQNVGFGAHRFLVHEHLATRDSCVINIIGGWRVNVRRKSRAFSRRFFESNGLNLNFEAIVQFGNGHDGAGWT